MFSIIFLCKEIFPFNLYELYSTITGSGQQIPYSYGKKLAYYVMNNELEPISCDYLYSELFNPVLPKDEENKSECVWEVTWQSDKGNTVFTV